MFFSITYATDFTPILPFYLHHSYLHEIKIDTLGNSEGEFETTGDLIIGEHVRKTHINLDIIMSMKPILMQKIWVMIQKLFLLLELVVN